MAIEELEQVRNRKDVAAIVVATIAVTILEH